MTHIPIPTPNTPLFSRAGGVTPEWYRFFDDLRRDAISQEADVATLTAAVAALDRTGLIFFWPGSAAPSYAAILDGSALSRTTYPLLWAIAQASGNIAATEGAKTDGEFGPGDGSTTFTLPDLVTSERFIRAVAGDDIGEVASWAIENITGTMKFRRRYTGSGGNSNPVSSDGVFSTASAGDNQLSLANDVSISSDTVTFNASTVVQTDTETRPIYAGLLPCIVLG